MDTIVEHPDEPIADEPIARFTQPMDRKLVWLLLALESGTFLTVSALMLATGAPVWWVLLLLAMIALPIVLVWQSRLTVRVDGDRLRYAFFPFWRGGIAYQEIERVEVVKIDSLGQFGGWGIKAKFRGKGLGLIARCGSGVRIERIGQRPVYITMDDADRLAMLIMERVVAFDGAGRVAAHVQVERRKPWWLWLPVWIAVGVMWWIFLEQIVFGRPVGNTPGPDALVWCLTIGVGIVLPVLFWMMRVVIRVDDDRLRVRLWPFPGRSWRLDEIADGERVRWINGLLFGGYGVRWLPGRGWLIAMRNGPGVLVRFGNGKRLRIVCENPEALHEAMGFADQASE